MLFFLVAAAAMSVCVEAGQKQKNKKAILANRAQRYN